MRLQIEAGGEISARELSSFLYHFRALYAFIVSSEKLRGVLMSVSEEKLPYEVATVMRALEEERARQPINRLALFSKELGADDLRIIRMEYGSPMEIGFLAFGAALTLAVIISGGKIEIGIKGVKAHLPPLAEGIKRLRDALK